MSEYEIKMNEVNQIVTQDGLKKWFGKNKEKQENKDKDGKGNKDKGKNKSNSNNQNKNRDSFEKIFMDKIIEAERVKKLISDDTME